MPCAACSVWRSSTAIQVARAMTSRRTMPRPGAHWRTLEKFGALPQDVLEGTRRPAFAPPIVRRGLRQRGDAAPDTTVGSTDAAAPVPVAAPGTPEDGEDESA